MISSTDKALKGLEAVVENFANIQDISGKAQFCRDRVIPAMCELRQFADELEMNVDADLWQLPTYAEMLFLK